MLARCLTPEMNSSIIRGLNAGVWYAPLQWPQFECQVTAHVRAGKREYRDAPSTITTKLSALSTISLIISSELIVGVSAWLSAEVSA